MSEFATSPEERAQAVAQALREGMTVVLGDPRHLLLDIDTELARAHYERTVHVLQAFVEATEESRWVSRNGNLHIVLKLGEDMPLVERVAWQAALGSDGMREALSLCRYYRGIEEPSMLFKPGKV